jgi:hypothetical protein
MYSCFWDDVCVQTVAEIDGINIITVGIHVSNVLVFSTHCTEYALLLSPRKVDAQTPIMKWYRAQQALGRHLTTQDRYT